MQDLKLARMMLDLARKDLKALKGMMDEVIFDDMIFGFHSQQATEKSLKAWIALYGRKYPVTHKIEVLLRTLQRNGANVHNYWNLVEYTDFAVQVRYHASMSYGDESLNREVTIHDVEELVTNVKELLGGM